MNATLRRSSQRGLLVHAVEVARLHVVGNHTGSERVHQQDKRFSS